MIKTPFQTTATKNYTHIYQTQHCTPITRVIFPFIVNIKLKLQYIMQALHSYIPQ